MIVLVPSMELGVQEAMLIYKLFGGSVNPGIPGASANMFAYTGPRGLKVTASLLPSIAILLHSHMRSCVDHQHGPNAELA